MSQKSIAVNQRETITKSEECNTVYREGCSMIVIASFMLSTEIGSVKVQIGQCFRENPVTKKISHFHSGYACWVLAVDKGVELSAEEVEKAENVTFEYLGYDLEVE